MTGSPRWLRIAAVPVMLAAGAMVALQSHLNGALAVELGTGPRAGFGAALISFGSGLVLVGLITAIVPSGRRGVRNLRTGLANRSLRPAEMVGGAFGAFLVATQGLTVGVIGVALFSIAVTAGQSSSALLVDHFGLGPSGHQALSIPRFIAATFAVVAVILAAGERLAAAFGWQTAVFAILALLAGAGTAVQQGLNGRLAAVGGPWATTLNNFIVGTTVLLACMALSLLGEGRFAPGLPTDPWLYAGGVMGVAFIWLAAVLVKVHGVLVLGLSMIAGNVMGAEIIELAGGETRIGWIGILAGALTVAGVLIAVLVRPRSPA
jgi:bacterial/archaeal transporter family-2 protein